MCIVIVSKKKKYKKLKFSIWILKIFLVLMRLFEHSPRSPRVCWFNKRAVNAGSVFLPRWPRVCWSWNCPFKRIYILYLYWKYIYTLDCFGVCIYHFFKGVKFRIVHKRETKLIVWDWIWTSTGQKHRVTSRVTRLDFMCL